VTRQRPELGGAKVLVLGLGRNRGGAGIARWAAAQGAVLRITDLRDARDLGPSLEMLAGIEADYVLGSHRPEDVEWADLVIRNPAVPSRAPMLELARRLGRPILMEMAVFALYTDALIVGITGTKGKTTTAAITHQLFSVAGRDARMIGNMGVPAFEYGTPPRGTVVTAELSSFQIEGLSEAGVSPPVAVITNFQRDHLDRYASYEEYIETKAGLLDFQAPDDWAILPFDSPDRGVAERRVRGRVAYFSAALPGGPPGPHAVWADREAVRLRWDGVERAVAWTDGVPLRGAHNLGNIAAAVAAVLAAGVEPDEIAPELSRLRPVRNRLESVAILDGVEFVNDTTATTPVAAAAGVEAFPGRDLVLIAGGSEKGLDQDLLARATVEHVRAVVLLPGSATPDLVARLRARGFDAIAGPFDTMAAAVEAAAGLAQPGGVVLLSPGATSYGQFLDEFDRAARFREAVLGACAVGRPEA
jgi:UDP-N-acetylmuramoylalanine--D-glutamate ligase